MGFADGSIFNLSAEFLRVHSPAVDSKIRSIGGEKVIVTTIFSLYNFCPQKKKVKKCCYFVGGFFTKASNNELICLVQMN